MADDRELMALRLKRSGLTLREIGSRMGLSRERVRQLAVRGERLETSPRVPDLSTRAANALKNATGMPLTVEVFSKFSESELLSLRNVSSGTVQEVRDWLSSHGYELRGR